MFQFHNGTINTSSFCAFNPPFRSFNSTTVQLIHLLQYFVFALPLFQFHNGTINTQVISFRVVSPFLFQFHNGTINTIITVLSAVLTALFQFHNGTINTHPIDFLVYNQDGFNSTTVQLIQGTVVVFVS